MLCFRFLTLGLLALLVVFSESSLASEKAESAQVLRARAAKNRAAGEWEEGLAIYRRLLQGLDDPLSGEDLKHSLTCLTELNLEKDMRVHITAALKQHSQNWRVLMAAAELHQRNFAQKWSAVPWEMESAENDEESDVVSASEHFRRALQLYERAMLLANNQRAGALEQAELLVSFAGCLGLRSYHEWETKSDLMRAWDGKEVESKDVASQKAVFYKIPRSWKHARNDGERWRWLLARVAILDSTRKTAMILWHAERVLLEYSVSKIRPSLNERQEAAWRRELQSLKPDETLLELPGAKFQTKKITLPQDQSCLEILRNVSGSRVSEADEATRLLSQEFLARHQRVAAAQLWREAIALRGDGKRDWRKAKLKAIEGDWGGFEGLRRSFPAGSEPEVTLHYRNAAFAEFRLYRFDDDAAIQDLLKYLRKNPFRIRSDVAELEEVTDLIGSSFAKKHLGFPVKKWTQTLSPGARHDDQKVRVKIPERASAWYVLEAKMGKDKRACRLVVPISGLTIVRRELSKGWLYCLVDSVNGRPVPNTNFTFSGAAVEEREKASLFGKRRDIRTKEFAAVSDDRGMLKISHQNFNHLIDEDDDTRWLTVARTPDGRHAWLDLSDQDPWGRDEDNPDSLVSAFGVTDRPMYRPGEELKVKFWVGLVTRDGKGQELSRKKFRLQIQRGLGKGQTEVAHTFGEVLTDEWGSLEGTWTLPEDADLGRWTCVLSELPEDEDEEAEELGRTNFEVEEFRKSEFEVTLENSSQKIALGRSFQTTVVARHLRGAPVREGKVHLKVKRCAVPFGKSELVYDKEHALSSEGRFVLETETAGLLKKVGDRNRSGFYFVIEASVTDAAQREERATSQVICQAQAFDVGISTERDYFRSGEEVQFTLTSGALDGSPIKTSGSLKLFRIRYARAGEVNEELVKSIPVSFDGKGDASMLLRQGGTYTVLLTLKNEEGETSSERLAILVNGGSSIRYEFDSFEVISRKDSYRPDEKARILLCAPDAGGTAILFVRSSRSKKESLRIIPMSRKTAEISLSLRDDDVPEIGLSGWWIGKGQFHEMTETIGVEVEIPKWSVTLTPDAAEKKPGSAGSVRVSLVDEHGKPAKGAVTLTIYDKALDLLAPGYLEGEMQSSFYRWPSRDPDENFLQSLEWSGEGFAPGKVLAMPDLNVYPSSGSNYFLGGGTVGSGGLRASSDFISSALERVMIPGIPASPSENVGHIVTAGLRSGAAAINRNSIDAILNNPTRLANPLPEISMRSAFSDLVKWQGTVLTNEKGEAEIEFDYPDNLTAWTIKAWAIGKDLHCAQAKTEVLTKKDLLVRLQTPRFFTETDEVELSAIVHNETDKAIEVDIDLEQSGDELELPKETLFRDQTIAAKGQRRVVWRTKARRSGESKLTVKAASDDLSDAVTLEIPVKIHGEERREIWSRIVEPGSESITLEFEIPESSKRELNHLKIQLSPTIALAAVDAIPYLVDYPYGCTEQTMNRFVPAVIARQTLVKMGTNLEAVQARWLQRQKEEKRRASHRGGLSPVFDAGRMEEMIAMGTKRLWRMQNDDGGWGWFSGSEEESHAHTTAVVLHGLIKAQEAGVVLRAERIKAAQNWLMAWEEKSYQALRAYQKNPKGGGDRRENADETDALVRLVLGELGLSHKGMLAQLLAHKAKLKLYGKCLLGHELHRLKKSKELSSLLENIAQYHERDEDSQTLSLRFSKSHAWSWSDDKIETEAWYLSLLVKVAPREANARALVRHLLKSRQYSGRWKSTRATGYCVEAITSWLLMTGEHLAEIEAEVLLDGEVLEKVVLTANALASGETTLSLKGEELSPGKHRVEIRRKGNDSLYANLSLSVFNQEKVIPAASSDLEVTRRFYRLEPVSGSDQEPNRIRVAEDESIALGDLIEVELEFTNRYDAEYLLLEDEKAAGFEALRQKSGYSFQGDLRPWMELRDERTAFMFQFLPKGKHVIRYQLRAEMAGKLSALPAVFEAMYAPELRANSREFDLEVRQE